MTKPSPTAPAAAARPPRPFRSALRRTATDLVGIEGLILALLLAVAAVPDVFRNVAPLEGAIAAMAATAVAGVAIRFRRGRPLHGLLVLAAIPAIALLPEAGIAATLAALLVPLNLALIALLPDRGVTTRGGVLRGLALAVQAGTVIALGIMAARAGGAADPLARLTLPGIHRPLDTILVAYAAALLVLATTTLARRDAAARGLFWAAAAALVVHLGATAGPVWPLVAGAVVLLVAALEDAHGLAFRDALTGLPSRRALDELLDRSVSAYTLAMVDIDHFKAFNDDYGHDVGDQVLRMVASRLADTPGAQAFRYGGEEFTLVFRGLTLEQARPLLDETRERVAAATFTVRAPNRPKRKPSKPKSKPKSKPRSKSKSKSNSASAGRSSKTRVWRGRQRSVTISIGAAERAAASQAPKEVVEAADRALYRAKRGGRNRVHAA